ncbi:MAG TPA: DUF4281 domain-containing protein [Gammaproteobacteria bacterium]|nr:DUF4281 domain-containing protein [Gammaproteobacteria bacterium]|tara:strand:- start:1013 stop:1462 length:450 start_codon:yes stop_codon:yes gene_type:complete
MSPEALFLPSMLLVGAAWLVLLLTKPSAQPLRRGALTTVIAFLGVLYAYFLFGFMDRAPADGSFSSVAGLIALFSVPELMLAGWLHYLILDFCAGYWIAKDASSHCSRLVIAPFLIATMVSAPVGLAIYLGLRNWLHQDTADLSPIKPI